jgi:uncharacterized protein
MSREMSPISERETGARGDFCAASGIVVEISRPFSYSGVRWLFLLLVLSARCSFAQTPSQAIVWHPWSDEVFSQAAREHKFVLLDLQAFWCHWCHVMDQETYSDPAVRGLMKQSYIAVKIDQDSRPDLSNRYEDYGWPATILFQADGSEIVREKGFIPPRRMASLLQAVIDDPSPGPSVTPETAITYATTPSFSTELLAELHKEFGSQYDLPDKGWDFGVKYLDADSMEYASELAQHGERLEERRVRDELRAGQKLLDPVWGGAYQSLVVLLVLDVNPPVAQYERIQIAGGLDSGGDSWNDSHFEKPLSVQAQMIRMYAQSYGQWHTPEYLTTAESVHRYVRQVLTSPEGAVYAGQDGDAAGDTGAAYFALDDAKRRALGVPRVDQHLYARENGWMIHALCALYAVTGDAPTLQEAERSAQWVITHRSLANGGFSHGEHDSAGPYLGDTLTMGQGFLALYEVTGNRVWLQRAKAAEHFLARNFAASSGAGFVTSKTSTNRAYKPHAERGENAQVARFANLLHYYTGDEADKETAKQAMLYLATPEIAKAGLSAPALLAAAEFNASPLHITIVGGKKDAAAAALFKAALKGGVAYKRVEWWDRTEGPLPQSDVSYPFLNYAAAFVCNGSSCSSAIVDPRDLESRFAKAVE